LTYYSKRNDLKGTFKDDDNDKPVFMTAANHKYYGPLIETIQNLKLFFPGLKLIIYDLGLKSNNLKDVCSYFIYKIMKIFRKIVFTL